MREKVCIVLNEREPHKARAAEELENRLKDLNITSSRLPIEKNIENIILEKLPPILVLDYLLGDYSTGLDVLTKLTELNAQKRPRAIFLTDEPSVPVAVEAMRLGAANYFEIENPQSINNVVQEITALLKSSPSQAKPLAEKSQQRLSSFVWHSKQSLTCLHEAQAMVLKKPPVLIILGPAGSGITTLAAALEAEKQSEAFSKSIDLRIFDGQLKEFFPHKQSISNALALGTNLSLLVDHADEDEGELLELTAKEFDRTWPGAKRSTNGATLTLCLNDEEVARAWKTLVPCEIVRVPPIQERKEDILPLVHRFLAEVQEFMGAKIKAFTPELISLFTKLDWPGQLRQLRAVIIDAAVLSVVSDEDTRDIVQNCKLRWEEESLARTSNIPLDPFVVASVYEESAHNIRLAAAKLGVHSRLIRSILTESKNGSGY